MCASHELGPPLRLLRLLRLLRENITRKLDDSLPFLSLFIFVTDVTDVTNVTADPIHAAIRGRYPAMCDGDTLEHQIM